MRNVLYGIAKADGTLVAQHDVLGYVDKDVEASIQLKDGE